MIFSTVFIYASLYLLLEPALQELVEPLHMLLSGGMCRQEPFTKGLSEGTNGYRSFDRDLEGARSVGAASSLEG